jgi:surface-anchored protein
MKRLGAAGLALAALGFVAVVPSAAAAPAAPATVSPAGADLVSVALDGAGELSLRLRTADRRVHDPATVLLPSSGGTIGAVPDLPSYDFLGEPGRPVWALAPTGTEFPAWDTTGVAPGQVADGSVTLELIEVDGPGAFHAYTMSPVGEPRLVLGTSGGAPQRAALPAGERHGGAVWAFDAPGSHRVTLAASTRLAAGGTVTDRATYLVEVPALPAWAPPLAPAQRAGREPRAAPARPAQQVAQQAPSDDETAEGRVVIADGHVDIGPRFVGDAWTIQVRDDTVNPEVWRNLHDVVLHAVDEAVIEVPDSEDFGFLGEPGAEVWLLPQAQQAGILWPGWNTQHESVANGITGDTTWTLREVDGPGVLVVFLTASFGQPQILFNSRETLPQDMSVPVRTHAHGNWAFTEPGVYHLTLEISATTTGGDEVSDTRIVAFAVGDQTDPNTAFPPAGDGGGGDGDGGGDGGGGLSQTGLNIVMLTAAGVLLLAGGGLLILLTRRRRARAAGSGS